MPRAQRFMNTPNNPSRTPGAPALGAPGWRYWEKHLVEFPHDLHEVPRVTRIFLEQKKNREKAHLQVNSRPGYSGRLAQPQKKTQAEYQPLPRPLDNFFPVVPKGTSNIFPGATRGRGGGSILTQNNVGKVKEAETKQLFMMKKCRTSLRTRV